MPNPKTEWLVWFYADNAFRKTTGGPTHDFTEATAYTYAEAFMLVRHAAIGEWPDGQPPAVMVRTLPEQSRDDMVSCTEEMANRIREAMNRMSDDRDTADWSHPVAIGGLPEDPDAPPLLTNVHELAEWIEAHNERDYPAETNALFERMRDVLGSERNIELWNAAANAIRQRAQEPRPDYTLAALVLLVSAARTRFARAEFAVRDSGVRWDVDPAVAEYWKALGALLAQADKPCETCEHISRLPVPDREPCDECDGSGRILTADGSDLVGFLARHGFWPTPRSSANVTYIRPDAFGRWP